MSEFVSLQGFYLVWARLLASSSFLRLLLALVSFVMKVTILSAERATLYNSHDAGNI